ncbi:MAG: hypothetical protein BGO35_15360 [Burkholderiales bacterium 64-34]|nr:MAG: hypothetical protein BGO35_15360 [Burkholderiales bacterium 64-34]
MKINKRAITHLNAQLHKSFTIINATLLATFRAGIRAFAWFGECHIYFVIVKPTISKCLFVIGFKISTKP